MAARSIEISWVANGWIAKVGCQSFAYNKSSDLVSDLKEYLDRPEEKEKQMLTSAVNMRYTNGCPIPVDPTNTVEQYRDALERTLACEREPRTATEANASGGGGGGSFGSTPATCDTRPHPPQLSVPMAWRNDPTPTPYR